MENYNSLIVCFKIRSIFKHPEEICTEKGIRISL